MKFQGKDAEKCRAKISSLGFVASVYSDHVE